MGLHALLPLAAVAAATQADAVRTAAGSALSGGGPPWLPVVAEGGPGLGAVAERIASLPGVERVVPVEPGAVEEAEREARASLRHPGAAGAPGLAGLRVELDRRMRPESARLLQRHLGRAGGPAPLAVGEPRNLGGGGSPWADRAGLLLVLALCLPWAAVNALAARRVGEAAYLVERFQRRTRVALKTYAALAAAAFAAPLALGALVSPAPPSAAAAVAALALLGALHYGKARWRRA